VLQDGDHVFFHYLCWGNAQHTPEQFKNGHYDGTKIGIECEGVKYLLMSETEVFFAKRAERFISVNDYLLLRAIPKEVKEEILRDARGYNVGKVSISKESGGLITEINKEENYRLDIAEVVACPDGCFVRPGDIVYPDKHWDCPLEYEILETLSGTTRIKT
jgi:iron only hydrogenase large subunit-like protein